MHARVPALPRVRDRGAAAGRALDRRGGAAPRSAHRLRQSAPRARRHRRRRAHARRPRRARSACADARAAARARAERDAAPRRGARRVVPRPRRARRVDQPRRRVAGVHDGIRGVPGHFDATLEAIRRLAPARHHRAGEHGRHARHGRRAAGDRAARAGVGRVHLGALLPRPGRPRREPRRADPGRERARLPLPRRRLAARADRAHGRGAVLPPRRAGRARTARLLPPAASTGGSSPGSGLSTGRCGCRRRGRATVAASSSSATTGRSRRRASSRSALGNVRGDDVVDVYRDHPLLRSIRAAEFGGRCGACTYRDLCGGSRARAYATYGDPLAEDPGCAFYPQA